MNDLNTACFLSAARTKNFSATAKELSITQQAVSRSIRKMEEELGFPLFIRNSLSMQLSKGGEYYYKWLTTLDESLNWASMHFGNSSGSAPSRFRIAFCDWVGGVHHMTDGAAKLLKRHPDLSIEYLTGSAADTFAMVEKGTADIVILPETAAFYITGYPDTYISTPFFSAQLNLYASREFAGPDGALDCAALRELPLLLSSHSEQTDDVIRRAAADALGLSALPDIQRLPNLDSVYTEVLCGNGYTVSPNNPVIGRAHSIHGTPLPAGIPIVAVWLQNRQVPWAPEFTELLTAEVEGV